MPNTSPSKVTYHPETLIPVNGVTLAYDAFGDPAGTPLLLIAGLGMQLIGWDAEMCRRLAAAGNYVVRYDQRDVGHSTRYDDARTPNLPGLFQSWLQGENSPLDLPYTLADLADDAAALMDALAIVPANVLGVSMGGMVAQLLAIRHPQRVRALICVSSSTLAIETAYPAPETVMAIFGPPATGREAYIQQAVQMSRLMHGPVLPFDAERARRRAAEAYDRGIYPAGTARQLTAIVSGIGWKADLPGVRLPTLVIHGDVDPLLPPAGGRDIAETVPGARYVEIPGMGHALPPAVWPPIFEEMQQLL
jgi:pimeloyl-ACP methyl ester carboxylesterase